ncbi:MAG: hypothetical protein AWU58_1569 [Methanohalophilus sp. T328-1]|nr:MAG: hypothetical protein AWU58_1569 [Methanohalophilus sp. T328-1]
MYRPYSYSICNICVYQICALYQADKSLHICYKNKQKCRYMQIFSPEGSLFDKGVLEELFFLWRALDHYGEKHTYVLYGIFYLLGV